MSEFLSGLIRAELASQAERYIQHGFAGLESTYIGGSECKPLLLASSICEYLMPELFGNERIY